MPSDFRDDLYKFFVEEIYTISEKTNQSRLLNKKELVIIDNISQLIQDNT